MPETVQSNGKELLLRAADGDEQAYAALFRRYRNRVMAYLLRIVPQEDIAEELANDVFLQVWLSRKQLPEIRNLETWLFVLSRNRAVSLAKKSLRERKNLKQWLSDVGQPDDVARIHRAMDLIDEALLELSGQQRKCWTMSRRMRMTYREIEQELNISGHTVKTHIELANAAIKKYVIKRIDLPGLIIIFLTKYL